MRQSAERKHEDVLLKNINTTDVRYSDMNRLLNSILQRTSAANFIKKIFLAVYDIVPKRGKKEETIFSFESFEHDALKQRRARSLLPFVPYGKYRSISTTTSWQVRITSTVISVSRTNGNLICDSVINSLVYRFPAAGTKREGKIKALARKIRHRGDQAALR